ncbi:MAG TPA: hypothetical protein VM871_03770 [Flavisolibacter sp.]|jgi:hypothetical protein|nr:hypothetical protein [Flavisolibacter sp.]
MNLTEDSNFLVRENTVIHKILGFISLSVFIVSLTSKADPGYEQTFHFEAIYLMLLPAIIFLWKGFSKKSTIIKINRQGFFYYGKHITNWDNFVDARLAQDEIVISIQDNFVLFVRYKKNEGGIYQRKFPLTNTQDKAEEEIIAAIRFFRNAHFKIPS